MSLYEYMKKERGRIFTVGKDYSPRSRLLEDIKEGKEPEKKHKTLDQFFVDSQTQVIIVV